MSKALNQSSGIYLVSQQPRQDDGSGSGVNGKLRFSLVVAEHGTARALKWKGTYCHLSTSIFSRITPVADVADASEQVRIGVAGGRV